MFKKITQIGLGVLLAGLIFTLAFTFVVPHTAEAAGPGGQNQPGGKQGQTGQGQTGGGTSQGTLTDAEIDALYQALDDEYHAYAVYQGVLDTFGDVSPFNFIAQAEIKHAEAIARLLTKYGLPVPENTWIDNVPTFDTLEDACSAAYTAEVENASLYDTLLASTTRTDLTRVFTNLQTASLNSHLPAFEACSP